MDKIVAFADRFLALLWSMPPDDCRPLDLGIWGVREKILVALGDISVCLWGCDGGEGPG